VIVIYEITQDHPDAANCHYCTRKYHKELMKLHGNYYLCMCCHMEFLGQTEFGTSIQLALQVLDNDETLN